ncbi:MAG: PKD domain-containing protein [Planctomycetota bacterium]
MRVNVNRNGVVAALVLSVVLGAVVSAAETTKVDPRFAQLGPLAGKLDRRLIPSVQAVLGGKKTGAELTTSVRSSMAKTLAPSPVNTLALTLDVPNVNEELLASIQATGATVVSSAVKWNSVSVHATMEQIAALTSVPGIRTLSLGHKPIRRQAGSTDNQADTAMKADQARVAGNVTGKNTKIGVISDSCNNTSIGPGTVTGLVPNATLTGMTNQISGDLPTSIQVIDFGPIDGQDEGAAIMELIHDVAPGAALAFASAGANQTTFATNLLALAAAGCKITVDDIGFPDEPFFQDGPIAQAIRTNNGLGVTHFTAVGNDGDAGVLANYVAINSAAAPDNPNGLPSGNFFHNWGIAGATPGMLPIDVPDGTTLQIILQWNQPFASFGLGAGSSVDMDAYLYDGPNPATANILGFSADPQFVNNVASNDPHEIIDTYSNTTGVKQRVYLAVNLTAGSKTNLVFRTVIQSDFQLAFPSGGVSGMTAFGHTTLDEAISVGAIFYADIASGGKWAGVNNDEDANAVNAENFSSKGGIGINGAPFYFDTAGAPLPGGPVKRSAPTIAAPDGGNTTFFGSDISLFFNNTTYDTDSAPNFFGTSAAAPNAAAVAALLLERAPLSTPAQIKAALQSTAIDVVATSPLSISGPDDRTGSGLIDALAAFNAVPGVITDPVSQSILEADSVSFSITAVSSATLLYQWQKNGVNISNQTNPTLSLTNVPFADDNSKYACVVTNSFGTTVSATATLTVHQRPVFTLHPANQIINYGSTGTFSAQAINGSITYQWKRNGQPITNATNSSYTTPVVTSSNDNATYTCVATNQFASTTSNPAQLISNAPPALVSGPTANPTAAVVGQTISFSSSAAGSNGNSITYSWDFGDGTNAQGANVTHVYTSAANYTVTLSVTDSNNAISTATLKEIIFVDANHDGFPDLDPNADNSSFVDAFGIIKGLTPQSLSVKSLTIGLNFSKPKSDSLTLSGLILVPQGFSASGQTVIAIVGGVGRTFVLDAKGKAVATPDGTFKLTYSSKAKGEQFGKYTLKIAKANLRDIVAISSNLKNETVRNDGRTVRASLFFNNGMYDILRPQSYTATLGKTGKTK